MPLPPIDSEFVLSFLSGLVNTSSPAGLAEPAIAFTEQSLTAFPEITYTLTRKDALVATKKWVCTYMLS